MARRPKANSHDNTVRNIFIGFAVIILIVGALLVWNNRSLSFAGTIDGERMPIEHLNFYQVQAWQALQWEGWPDGPQLEMWALEIGFDSLQVLHLVTGRAADFGLSVADVDAAEVDRRVAELDRDFVTRMGFNNRTFRQFIELQVLHELVFEHITGLVTVDEDEITEAFEQHVDENFTQFTQVMVHLIVVEEESQADAILAQIMGGADFTELMREHSVIFDEEYMFRDDAGDLIYAVDFDLTILFLEPGFILLAYDMEEGDVSDVLHMADSRFAIMEAVEVNQLRDMDEVEATFREEFRRRTEVEYFHDRLDQWREEADIVPNSRIIQW